MEFGIIISCLILSAFFTGMEAAFVSSNKIYLEIEKKQDNFFSTILNKLTEKPSRFLVAMLTGNSIAIIVFGIQFSHAIRLYCAEQQFNLPAVVLYGLQIVLAVLVYGCTAGWLPKVFFQIYANSLIKFFAVPAYFFYLIFSPLAGLLIYFSDRISKFIFRNSDDGVPLFFTKIELGDYITEQMNSIDEATEIDTEIVIFQNALEFSGVKAREVMTPRTEIVAVEVTDDVFKLLDTFIKTGYSKIMVFDDSLDNCLGYVHSFEMFKKPESVESVMIKAEFVPETMLIKDVLSLLTKKRKSMAVVLDEYGGTAGVLTIEDIVEELFGEIEDEHDLDELLIEQDLGKGKYVFSARLDVSYLNQTYKLQIPESDAYETLGGYLVDFVKEIPLKNTVIAIDKFQYTIVAASNKKIEIVKMNAQD
ncbi:hemolysin family protein [Flavobacterium sp. GNP001]